MKLIIENIGIVTSVTVDLASVTVIAGENDSGKSTVGKVFFALIQAFANYPLMIQNERKEHIRETLDKIFFDLRRNFDLAEFPDIRNMFIVARSPHRIDTLDDHIILEMTLMLDMLRALSPDKKNVLKHSQDRLAYLRDFISTKLSEKEAISNVIFKALQSEFSGELVRKSQVGLARIVLIDGETKILEMTLSDEKVFSFYGEEEIEFLDATFVDGPAVIQFSNAMNAFNPLGESTRANVSMPFHSVDLLQKLRDGTFNLFSISNGTEFELGNTYKGKMFFDKENKNFFLDKGNYRVSSNNIASGVKSLGMLDMLIEGGYVRDRTLLILDEPETNLHPKWQIEYAKILCGLAAKGATVLVTTHSPYMVEALKGFSDKSKIENNFYLATRSGSSELQYHLCSQNILPIIQALSEPLSNLVDDISDDF